MKNTRWASSLSGPVKGSVHEFQGEELFCHKRDRLSFRDPICDVFLSEKDALRDSIDICMAELLEYEVQAEKKRKIISKMTRRLEKLK